MVQYITAHKIAVYNVVTYVYMYVRMCSISTTDTRCILQIYNQSISKVKGNLPLINPEPKGQGVHQYNIIFVKYTTVAMVHMIYIIKAPH